MSRLLRIPPALFPILFLFCLTADSLAEPAVSPEQVRALFAAWDRPGSPGCSVGIIQDGEFVFKEGFGQANLELGVPIRPDSMFYACSVSKQFVAMSTLLLEEDGRLSLDDDIRKYLPDFPDYGDTITIRHLLHHTSGVKDYFGLWQMAGNDFQDYMPAEAVYELIRRQKSLNFRPGERHLYSNSCYFLLYRIIEKVSGQTLREYADENIFQPLGMTHTFFHDDYRRIIKNRASGYFPSKEYGFINMISRFDLVGSGGMFTCVEDFLPWDRNFYDNRLGRKSQDLIRRMSTSGRLNNGKEAGYAMALVPARYRDLEIIEHSGSLGGYRTHYLRFPAQRFSVVILSNLSSFDPGTMARRISDLYLEKNFPAFGGDISGESVARESYGPAMKPGLPALAGSEAEEYSGRYYSEELDCTYRITAENGFLQFEVRYNPVAKLIHEERDLFSGPDISIGFTRDERGGIDGFIAGSEGVKNIRFLKRGPGGPGGEKQ